MMIHLWHCNRWLQVRDENKGKVVACPYCKGRIPIPIDEPVMGEVHRPRSSWRIQHFASFMFGCLAMAIGAFVILNGLMMDTSVALDSEVFGFRRVTNLSLQASQRNQIMIGIALSGFGALILATREIIARLPRR